MWRKYDYRKPPVFAHGVVRDNRGKEVGSWWASKDGNRYYFEATGSVPRNTMLAEINRIRFEHEQHVNQVQPTDDCPA